MTSRKLALQDTMTIADAFVRSGFFSDTKSQAQAIVKILAGQEFGFGPMASMTGVHIVKGKVSLSANLMATALKRTGRYNYHVKQMANDVCEIEFLERNGAGWENIGISKFTIEDAKQAGLANSQTWRSYPRNMLFSRAMSNGVKWFAPDLYGAPIYTPDELGASVNGETGEVIEAEVVEEEKTPQKEEPATNDPAPRQAILLDDNYLRRKFHATGAALYGPDNWDKKRHELVASIVGDEGASSNQLSIPQANRLIAGMQAKIAQLPDSDLVRAQIENDDSIVNKTE